MSKTNWTPNLNLNPDTIFKYDATITHTHSQNLWPRPLSKLAEIDCFTMQNDTFSFVWDCIFHMSKPNWTPDLNSNPDNIFKYGATSTHTHSQNLWPRPISKLTENDGFTKQNHTFPHIWDVIFICLKQTEPQTFI